MTEFRYLRASEWGMTWARPPIAEKTPDPECYVHHSAGNHSDDAVTAFRALNKYAQDVKGYSALDYDVLVHRNPKTGVVTIGGGREQWLSAATLDRNEQGEAVCVLGYFHPGHVLSRQPHPDEIEGTARAIVWGIENGWIAANATILGHRDNPAHPGATGCPGDYLYQHLPTIRSRVAALLNPPTPGEDMATIAPVRLLDTRPLVQPVQPDQELRVPLAGDRPAGMTSAILNIIATDTRGGGYVTAWDGGQKPNTSNVNFDGPGQIRSNLAFVKVAADNTVTVSPSSSSCHLVIDQQGWAA